MSWVEKARLSAAAQAVRELRNGTTVGLGSGTTVLKALDLAAERIKKEHLNISWVPTSYQMEIAARKLGLKTTTLSEDTELDLALDGADQVQWRSLDLVKGGGAALLREKIVDSTTKKLVIIIDEKKLAKTLGGEQPIPVEIAPFIFVLDKFLQDDFLDFELVPFPSAIPAPVREFVSDKGLRMISNPLPGIDGQP